MKFKSSKEFDNAILHKLDIENSILDELLLIGDLQGIITSELGKNAIRDILERSTIKYEEI